MKVDPEPTGRRVLDGALWVFAAEALMAPTMLLTAAYLSRSLGPAGYGELTVSSTIVAWVQWTISALFARATITLIAQADDWKPIAITVVRLHFWISMIAAAVLVMLAQPIGQSLHSPVMASYLKLLAVDIPLFSLAHAHRHLLVGLGRFRERALAGGLRWVARLVFIVVLVESGLSVDGAILGSIGASLVELAVCRWFVRPPMWGSSTFPARSMASWVAPLFLFALSIQVFERADLLFLKLYGGTSEQAGIYAAAQHLSLLPGLLALAISTPFLSTLTVWTVAGQDAAARRLVGNAVRAVLWLAPFIALVGATSDQVVEFIYGPSYAGAAPLLRLLIIGALARVMLSVSTAALTAAGRPGVCLAIGGPLVLLAVVGHILLIPSFGAAGAAATTTALAVMAAAVSLGAVRRHWHIGPPLDTMVRSTVVSLAVVALAPHWPASGNWLLVKLPTVGCLIAAALLVLGEFRRGDLVLLKSLIRPGSLLG